MPFISDDIKLPHELDRRVRVTEDDKDYMRYLYDAGFPVREIARIFDGICSRRMIQFVLFPERLQVVKKQFAERRKDGRYKYTKEEWRKVMAEHRNYKHQLYLNKKI